MSVTTPVEVVASARQGEAVGLDQAIEMVHAGAAGTDGIAWLEMMDARVVFTDYFLHVRDDFSVLEGQAPVDADEQTALGFTNFSSLADTFVEKTEEGFEQAADYAEGSTRKRDFTNTRLHHALVEGNLTAQSVMRLIISDGYHGLDSAGGVIGASRSQVLALLKHVQEMADIAHARQNYEGTGTTELIEAGQFLRDGFEAGQRIINHALEGLLPAEVEAKGAGDDN